MLVGFFVLFRVCLGFLGFWFDLVGCWLLVVGCCLVVQVFADVLMNLLHQRRDGDEGAAQRLGSQHGDQLFLVLAGWVNSRVLRRVCRVLQFSSHVFGFGGAAVDFCAQCALPRRLVAPFATFLKRLSSDCGVI